MSTSILDRLSEHKTIGAAPRQELEWLAANGELRRLEEGGVLSSKNMPAEGLYIVLTGHLAIYLDRGGGRRKFMEWRGGEVTGVLPYSRLVAPPADVVAEEATEYFLVKRELFPQMIRGCNEVTAILVHVMLDRARVFKQHDLLDEKLVALGTLAAGLAHQLNNPASAIKRSANALLTSLGRTETAARTLGGTGLTKDQLAMVDSTRGTCMASVGGSLLSPLELEERENSIADWLKERGANIDAAEPLSETDLSLSMLNRLAEVLDGKALDVALQYVAASFSTCRLIGEIEEAATRVYNLVAEVKGFTQMDRAAVSEPVDVGRGLANTLAMLKDKARAKSIGVTLNIAENLPRVDGFAVELNQVWTNLIDNALDAVGESGRVEVTAACKGDSVVVRIIDNGKGISPDVGRRIFEPFFTTKAVGSGTGLGLGIAKQLLQRNNGEIDFESQPGHTEFVVRLPMTGTRAPRGTA